MNEQEIQNLLGSQIWWLGGLALLFLVRKLIESIIEGFLVFCGSNYQNDDTVWIDGRCGRIVRQGLYQTVFYLYDLKTDPFTGKAEISGGNKLVIQNSALKDMRIEKPLTNIDISRYDKAMNDPACRRNGEDEPQGN